MFIFLIFFRIPVRGPQPCRQRKTTGQNGRTGQQATAFAGLAQAVGAPGMQEKVFGIAVGQGPAGGMQVPAVVAHDLSQRGQIGFTAPAGNGTFQRCSTGGTLLGQVGIFECVHRFGVHRSEFAFIR